MMIMKKYRFIERDYMFNKMKNNSEYLTDEQINMILDMHQWCDLTFRFREHPTGWKVIVTDNDTECDVQIDDLNNVAYDYMMRKLAELTINKVQKSQNEIKKIKEILYA